MFSARVSLVPFVVALLAAEVTLAQPQTRTTEAFDHYVAEAEARITRARGAAGSFLRIESLPVVQRTERVTRLRRGEILIEKAGDTRAEIPGGLIHDWLGTVFIPHATVTQLLGVVQDYDHLTRYYSPDVMQSRLVSRAGDDWHVFMRLHKHKVVTVVLDTEYSVRYGRLDAAHQFSLSRSTRVTEITDPGGRKERALADGDDHGFMWRLNTYWAFEQAADGVFVECEAISLTRDIPAGLGWLIGPFIQSIPRESLQFTLNATRAALAGKALVNNEEGSSRRPTEKDARTGDSAGASS
jgi:hypothetical protein